MRRHPLVLPSLWLAAALLAGCRGGGSQVVARPDPVDVTDATPKVADAGPPAPEAPTLARYALVVGQVVDLDLMKTTHALASKVPKGEAVRGDRGYLLGDDGVLRAYDLGTGALLWKQKPAHDCRGFVAGARFVYCANDTEVTAFATKDGAPTALPKSKSTGAWGNAMDTIELKDRLVVLSSDEVRLYEGTTLAPVGSRPWTVPSPYPAPYDTELGPCIARHGSGLVVTCLDAMGGTRFSKTYPTTKPGESSSWFQVSSHAGWALAANSWGKPERSVLVDADGTEVARVERNVIAPVVRAKPKPAIDGLVVSHPKGIELLELSGTSRWTAATKPYGETGRAFVEGETIVLAVYHRIASGCQLFGLDRATGKLLWTGDVLQLPIAHSIYSNDVELELRPGSLVRLSGHEAGIRYEQLFEVSSGKRVFAEARMRW
jgi:outer membrane protein assembly factor BamB